MTGGSKPAARVASTGPSAGLLVDLARSQNRIASMAYLSTASHLTGQDGKGGSNIQVSWVS
jgi:hypothetical protein